MAVSTVELVCPSCAARVEFNQKKCAYCDSPLCFSEFNDVYSMPLTNARSYIDSVSRLSMLDPTLNSSAGMCCLKLGLYEKALEEFEKAISLNFNNSETYFYAAVAALNGKKAFLCARPVIDKAERYINAAIAIEPKGIYYYFSAYIKYDYYERKFLNTTPDYRAALALSEKHKASEFDKEMLFNILAVPRPKEF